MNTHLYTSSADGSATRWLEKYFLARVFLLHGLAQQVAHGTGSRRLLLPATHVALAGFAIHFGRFIAAMS
jgi:hypothetical protein